MSSIDSAEYVARVLARLVGPAEGGGLPLDAEDHRHIAERLPKEGRVGVEQVVQAAHEYAFISLLGMFNDISDVEESELLAGREWPQLREEIDEMLKKLESLQRYSDKQRLRTEMMQLEYQRRRTGRVLSMFIRIRFWFMGILLRLRAYMSYDNRLIERLSKEQNRTMAEAILTAEVVPGSQGQARMDGAKRHRAEKLAERAKAEEKARAENREKARKEAAERMERERPA